MTLNNSVINFHFDALKFKMHFLYMANVAIACVSIIKINMYTNTILINALT